MLSGYLFIYFKYFSPLNTELNPICHLLALVGAHHIVHVSKVRVNVGLPSSFMYNQVIRTIKPLSLSLDCSYTNI